MQIIPKIGGITTVGNDNNEIIPRRMVMRWWIYIDYRNDVTCKHHFPLPFIEQMLKRLLNYASYWFLYIYSGYNQIVIAPKDQ